MKFKPGDVIYSTKNGYGLSLPLLVLKGNGSCYHIRRLRGFSNVPGAIRSFSFVDCDQLDAHALYHPLHNSPWLKRRYNV